MTIDKMEWHEIVSETMKLLQGVPDQEKEMAVAAIAAGCGMAAEKNSKSGSSIYKRPYSPRK